MSLLGQGKAALKSRLSPAGFYRLRDAYAAAGERLSPFTVWRLRRKNTGRRTYVDRSAHVLGWRNVRIGADCVISADCWLNVNNRAVKDVAITIGDHSFIGRRNFFSSGACIDIGPYALTGIDCRFMGSDHVFGDPFRPYIDTGTTDNNTIRVGANCWLGAGVTVLGDVSVGYGSILGAGALVTKDVPPFSLVVGSPARVIRRYDVDAQAWVAADAFTPAHEARLPAEDDYLAALRANTLHIRMPLAAAGRSRGDLP